MKTGVLLINLGTPDAPTTSKVRKYLSEFLNDKRVIDINAIARLLLVNLIIVPFRSAKSAKLYKEVWTKRGSPLLFHSTDLREKLEKALPDKYVVELAMRYQNPDIPSAMERLRQKKVEKIIVIPLYPQYASSTTGSTIEKVMDELKSWEAIPELKFITHFYRNNSFIKAFAKKAEDFDLESYDHILFSYHGLPERHMRKIGKHYGDNSCKLGDCCNSITEKNQFCYRANCFETTRRIANEIGLEKSRFSISFQSRLGRDPWIQPYTDEIISQLAKEGKKKLLVFSPSFVADCLETVHEIGVEYNELFHEKGGEKIDLVPSLNSDDAWVNAVKEMVIEN